MSAQNVITENSTQYLGEPVVPDETTIGAEAKEAIDAVFAVVYDNFFVAEITKVDVVTANPTTPTYYDL